MSVNGPLPWKSLREDSTTAECQSIGQCGLRKYFHQRSAQHQILLNLKTLDPRCPGPPCSDMVMGDHRSTSMSALT